MDYKELDSRIKQIVLSYLMSEESWEEGQPIPEEKTPTHFDLARWYPDCPYQVKCEIDTRINAVYDLEEMGSSRWYLYISGRVGTHAVTDFPLSDKGQIIPHLTLLKTKKNGEIVVIVSLTEFYQKYESEKQKHTLKNLLAPLVKSWLWDRPEPIESDNHDKGIIPKGLFSEAPAGTITVIRDQEDKLPTLTKNAEKSEVLQLTCPGFEETNQIVQAPYLILSDMLGMGSPQPGRGARIDKRLLYHCLINMPRIQRRPGIVYEYTPELKKIASWIFPNHWRPGKHGPVVKLALHRLSWAGILQSNGTIWHPLTIRQTPDMDNPDSQALIEIRLPEGCNHGAVIDKQKLIEEGMISDPAFDAQLGLAYLWDNVKAKNGGFRIHAVVPEVRRNSEGHALDHGGKIIMEKGKPTKKWNHPRAIRTNAMVRHSQADRVPILSPKELHFLFYGNTWGKKRRDQRSRELKNARTILKRLEREGQITIEEEKEGWRILEVYRSRKN